METSVLDIQCFAAMPSDEILRQCEAIATGLPEYFNSQGLELLKRDLASSRLCTASLGGFVVGFGCVSMKFSQAAEILWMAVARDRQGQGIGARMLDAIYQDLRSAGVAMLSVKTLAPTVEYEPYARTRRFYERNGFIMVEIVDPYPEWEPGNPCAIYVRALTRVS